MEHAVSRQTAKLLPLEVIDVVAEALNPYRQWLGLDTDAEQLNHYELLDLPLFAEDADEIHHAADRALARVRSHRPGAQAVAWAQLLDALAQAKACLGDPAKKAAYDHLLRTQQQAAPHDATAAQDTGPTPHSTSDAPEVASVNQLPDLFPPGMAPTASEAPATPQPKTVPSAASTSTAPDTSQPAGSKPQTSKPQAKSPQKKPSHKKPPPPPAPSTTVSRAGRLLDDPDEATGTLVSGISEPVPPAPVNAHVAPPRHQPASLLPVIASVVAVVVVITLLVVFLAMRGSIGGSTSGSSSLPSPAPAVKQPAAKMNRSAKDPSLQNPLAGFPPIASPPADTKKQSPVNTTAGGAPAQKATGVVDPPTPAVTIQPSPIPQAGVTQEPMPPEKPLTGAVTAGGVATGSPPTPTRAELIQLSRTLTDVQFAVGQHDFERAKLELQNATALAVLPKHQALVARLQQLTDHSDLFWQTVSSTLRRFQGAEELKVGSGGLVVLVVEAGPTSITVRKEGRNWRYTLTDMPPGLAIAIAKTQLKTNEPAGLLQLGACLATLADRKPAYLDEARKYWLQAQAAGADVDQLLLTLTDSYELAQ